MVPEKLGLAYVVQGCVLYKGVCCTRVYVVQGCMLYKGVCCTRVYVVQGCMELQIFFSYLGCNFYVSLNTSLLPGIIIIIIIISSSSSSIVVM